jgi:GT2 family glycosyltransferase
VRLSAIVVALGKERVLEECLDALETALARVDGVTELIVVVNDGSASMLEGLRERPHGVVAVSGEPGLGFAGAVRAGLEAAHGEWIALVNDDCTVCPDALEELLAVGNLSRDVGSVAAQIRFAEVPGTVNSAGIEVDQLGVARERRLGEPVAAVEPEPVEVAGASGAFALYRREMLDSVGGVDVSFFAYLEDADLAWRAKMAGWRCLLSPRAIAFHRHSATLGHGSSAKHLLVGRNRVRMLAKNASGPQLRRELLPIVGYDLLYVGYVAATARTLAPLTGRLRGLAEWRAYRAAGSGGRRDLLLSPAPGLRAALRRNRVYRSLPSSIP